MNSKLLLPAACLLMPLAAAAAPDSGGLSSREQKERLQECLAHFSIDSIAARKNPPLIYGTKSPIVGMVAGIRRYYECEAFTQGKPDLCKALPRYQAWELYDGTLKPAAKIDDFEYMCRNGFLRSSLIRINVSGRPDAVNACKRLPFPITQEHRSPEDCAWLMSREPSEGCRDPLAPTLGEDAMSCIYHRILHADAGICPLIKNAPLAEGAHEIYQGWCRDAAAYREAYQAKDAGLCGDSLGCRSLMGEKVCERHLDRLKMEFCRSWARETPAGEAGLAWMDIPGGSFMMGSGFRDEAPVHRVTISSFQMARAPATFKQYGACVQAEACAPAHVSDGTCEIYDGAGWKPGNLASSFQGDDQPAVCVDWNQANAFCRWAGGRLPSEAEWEYAARSGGKNQKSPWGDEGATCERAVIDDGGLGCGRNATWPVCSKPKGMSEQGLCDMVGNVWQWVQDSYHDSYNGAPSDGKAWISPHPFRVIRGSGSWNDVASYSRAAYRINASTGSSNDDVGIRCAR